jgi:hypothetical protein
MNYKWSCPFCETDISNWPYETLVDKGSPVCPNCDGTMEYNPVKVKRRKKDGRKK